MILAFTWCLHANAFRPGNRLMAHSPLGMLYKSVYLCAMNVADSAMREVHESSRSIPAGFVVMHAYKVYRINQSLLLPYPWDGTRACLAVSLK